MENQKGYLIRWTSITPLTCCNADTLKTWWSSRTSYAAFASHVIVVHHIPWCNTRMPCLMVFAHQAVRFSSVLQGFPTKWKVSHEHWKGLWDCFGGYETRVRYSFWEWFQGVICHLLCGIQLQQILGFLIGNNQVHSSRDLTWWWLISVFH